ncbi:MAG: hypothetical protein KJZ84_23900 [Bryobacteraceae bacterium]|nr:hypothetical protein [Bryobacteraceae bacterium]
MSQPTFIPFPEAMAEHLRQLELTKQNIVAGYLYALKLTNKRVEITPDLSGIAVIDQAADDPNHTQPTDKGDSNV